MTDKNHLTRTIEILGENPVNDEPSMLKLIETIEREDHIEIDMQTADHFINLVQNRNMSPEELENNLAYFSGSENYFVWSSLYPKFYLTDGANYLAEKAEAHWLMDIIGSYQHKLLSLKHQEYFQVWRLTVDKQSSAGRVVADDGNDNQLIAQEIPYTDFPLSEIKLYAIWDGRQLVILLPNEY